MADSSVLISLSAIQQLDLLHKRFPEVLIPLAVWQEVVIEGKGQPGAQEVQSSDQIKVEEVKDWSVACLLQVGLGQGERVVIRSTSLALGMVRSNFQYELAQLFQVP